MKRIAFCFDGTWNRLDREYPTNVARIAQSIARRDEAGNAQLIHYDEGVGTTRTARWTGGILGHGLTENIAEAYHFLVLNYEPGDALYVFGFSRGAFTARSFVGLIRNCGIMSRRSLHHIAEAVALYQSRAADAQPGAERVRQFRFEHCPSLCLPGDREWRTEAHASWADPGAIDLGVDYLGVWDTVGALGVPAHMRLLAGIANRKYRFHDTELSGVVRRARHAVAADERRRSFAPALWSNLADLDAGREAERRYRQLIFPGVHAAIGGGGPVRGLSDLALDWVLRGAREAGLAFDTDPQSPIYDLRPDHRAQLFNAAGKTRWSIADRIVGAGLADRRFTGIDRTDLDDALARRFAEPGDALPEKTPYRPASLRVFWPALTEMTAGLAAIGEAVPIAYKGLEDDRALRSPDSVRSYVIAPGDTLRGVATREMAGPGDEAILFLHNRAIGRLTDPDKIYAGVEIEIPSYAASAEQVASADG